jgi:hypothetical protein
MRREGAGKRKPQSLYNKKGNTANVLLLSWEIKTCGMNRATRAIYNRHRNFNYNFLNFPINPILLQSLIFEGKKFIAYFCFNGTKKSIIIAFFLLFSCAFWPKKK